MSDCNRCVHCTTFLESSNSAICDIAYKHKDDWFIKAREGKCVDYINNDDLRKCPFCGESELRYQSRRIKGQQRFWVVCSHCKAKSDTAETKQWARGLWNRRSME